MDQLVKVSIFYSVVLVCSVLQLIKSQKVPNKLMITVETEKEKTQKKDYIFADSKVNSHILIQLLKLKSKINNMVIIHSCYGY